MDTSDPEITFDASGRCHHCRKAEQKLAEDWRPDQDGEKMLMAAAEQIRQYGEGRDYDCIVGVSGGVDSSYVLHVAKSVMGLRPLAVHVDAGWNSEIAVKNIESLITALDVDLYTHVIDWQEMKDLQLAFLRSSVANQDVPQDHAFEAVLSDYADRNDIRFVITGSNITSESILPTSWGYDATDVRHLRGIHDRFGERELKTFPTMSPYQRLVRWPYLRRITRVAPLDYLDYDKDEAISQLERQYGWRYYGRKHGESQWTAFFQAYYLPTKFGFDKRRAHLSSQIVAGQVARGDALELLKDPPNDESRVERDKDYVARKLGIEGAELERLMALPEKSYADYPNNARLLASLRRIRRVMTSPRRQARPVTADTSHT